MYSHGYDTWKDSMVSVWKQMSQLYDLVADKPITEHVCLQEGVYLTVYGDEIAVYTNYNTVAATVNGLTVDAQSYRIEVVK